MAILIVFVQYIRPCEICNKWTYIGKWYIKYQEKFYGEKNMTVVKNFMICILSILTCSPKGQNVSHKNFVCFVILFSPQTYMAMLKRESLIFMYVGLLLFLKVQINNAQVHSLNIGLYFYICCISIWEVFQTIPLWKSLCI